MVDKTGVVDGFTRVTEAPECQKFCWGTSLCSGHNLPHTPLQGPDWNIIDLSAPKLSPHVPKPSRPLCYSTMWWMVGGKEGIVKTSS